MAFSLAVSLFVPNPAFALRNRNAGLEEKTHITRELGGRLLGDAAGDPSVAAGAEESEAKQASSWLSKIVQRVVQTFRSSQGKAAHVLFFWY